MNLLWLELWERFIHVFPSSLNLLRVASVYRNKLHRYILILLLKAKVTCVLKGSVQQAQVMARSSLYKLNLKLWWLTERQLLRDSLCPIYNFFFCSWFKNISPSVVLPSISLQNAIRHHVHIELSTHMILANPSLLRKSPGVSNVP